MTYLGISRRFLMLALVLALSLALSASFACGDDDDDDDDDGGDATTAAAEGDDDDGGALTVTAVDTAFEETALTVAAGSDVSIDFVNDGAGIHNLRIAGADGEYDSDDDAVSDPDSVPGGESATVEWTAPDEPGEVAYRCDFHPTQMTGTITVE